MKSGQSKNRHTAIEPHLKKWSPTMKTFQGTSVQQRKDLGMYHKDLGSGSDDSIKNEQSHEN